MKDKEDRGTGENMSDIFTSLSPNIPLGSAARQMSNIHLLLLSPGVGNCSFFFTYMYFCYFHVFISVYVLACELRPLRESETAERPDRDGC